MSSGNITDGSNNGNGADKVNWQCVASPDLIKQVEDSLEVQIAKFDEQEVQRKAKEERKKAEEEAKKKAEEDTQKRAEFQVWRQANTERKVREKAEVKAVSKVMKAHIVQKAAQGEKPKPKVCGMELFSSFHLLTYSSNFSNVRQPVSACPTRKSRGGTPHATNAGRVATARRAPCLTMHGC